MAFGLWGTMEERKPLSDSIKNMLNSILGSAQPRPIPALEDLKLSEVRLSDTDLDALKNLVGSQYVSTDREQRVPRALGKSYFDLLDTRLADVISCPDAVVTPATEDEVLKVLQWCTAEKVAVVPFGGGTSVVGGVTPLDGGLRAVISLDLARFDAVEDVDPISGEATLGAGMSGPHAEIELAKHGLQLGHFPQSFPYATIGGFAATRSSGQNSAGYGRFDEMVRSMTVVTPQGIIEPGHAAPSSAAGPDMREIFLGSEGTFGIITRVRCNVHPIPEAKAYEAFVFPNFDAGVNAVRMVEQTGTGPTVIRLSDEVESATNLTSTDSIGTKEGAAPKGCLCLTMYEGSPDHVESRHKETRELLLSLGGQSIGEAPVRKWEKGRFGSPVLRDSLLDVGALCETFETATDWSNVARLKKQVTAALTDELTKSGTMCLVLCHVSHVYANGCSLYFTVVATQNDQPRRQWEIAKVRVMKAIVDNGGTITHHHAIGTDHVSAMPHEIGAVGIQLMQAIKSTLDPAGILNPGKLVSSQA